MSSIKTRSMLVTVIAEHAKEPTEPVRSLLHLNVSTGIARPDTYPAYRHFPVIIAYQWAAIVPKDAMHFKSGEDNLHFYSTNLKEMKYVLPCKVSFMKRESVSFDL
jgi:hypothetical protein